MSTEPIHRESVVKGTLPTNVGVLLLCIAMAITTYIAVKLTLPVIVTVTTLISGCIAAVGVRLEKTDITGKINIGVISLGAGSIGYVAAFALGVLLNGYAEIPGYIVPIMLSCIFLVPIGIISNTLRSFGYGHGKSVVTKYAVSIVLMGGITLLFGVINVISTASIGKITRVSPPEFIQGTATLAIVLRVFCVIFLSAGALYIFKMVINRFPLSVFFPIDAIETVTAIRTNTNSIVDIGLRVIGVYVLVCIAWGVSFIALDEYQPLLRSVIQTTTTIELVYLLALCNGIGVMLLATKWLLTYLSTITEQDVIGISSFPVVGVIGAVIANQFYNQQIVTEIEAIPVVDQVIIGIIQTYPITALLGAVTIISGIPLALYTTPTAISAIRSGNKSLTGVILTVTSITTLGIITIISWQTATPIVLSVIGVLTIWGVSEYSVTTIGELQQPNTNTVPTNTYKTIGVQSVAVIITGCIAVGITIGIAAMFGTIELDQTAGRVILLVSIFGLLPLAYVMSG